MEGKYFYIIKTGERINIAKISQAFSEKLYLFLDRGYRIKSVKVQFCVYWKGKTDELESLILLPEIYLEKSKVMKGIKLQ